ncbi:MAG TPA: zinc metallopeptidase [Candidatus Saccharimonadales bacterium]|nr:zinc metallopeptidase [Candidatus Saccharimonadales bacterium]
MILSLIGLSYWWLAIPGLLLGIYAQMRLMSTYGKYTEVPAQNGVSGAQAAREILDQAGLANVPVEEVGGHLTDHYDPTKKALFLSSDNFHGTSLAAVGVAAHEAGHALQDKASYAPLKLRMALVPITQFASFAWAGLFILGWFFGMFYKLVGVAILIFSIIAFFQLVTLPVEYDASRRAKERLFSLGIVQSGEREGVSRVLSAAALTYVAALVTSVLQLLRFVMISRDRD